MCGAGRNRACDVPDEASNSGLAKGRPTAGGDFCGFSRLSAGGCDLSRCAFEALLAEAYKHDRLTKPELQQLLGIETSYELDGFLKAHDVWIEYTREDAEQSARACNIWVSDARGCRIFVGWRLSVLVAASEGATFKGPLSRPEQGAFPWF